MNWLNARGWKAVTTGASILTVLLLYNIVLPRIIEARIIWRNWQDQKERVVLAVTWEIEKTNLATRQLMLEQYFENLYISLPKSDQMSVILQLLQRRAEELEVRLNHVRPGERKTHVNYDELPLQVELQGSFHGIGAFINQVEQSQYLMKLTELELVGTPAPYSNILAELSLSVIILKEKEIQS